MTDKKTTYEDFVLEAGEVKHDLDVVYNPTMRALKTAFSLIFETANCNGTDFKRLSDMQFFQGGRPSANSPPKENFLAIQVANLIKLEHLIDKGNFLQYMANAGVRVEFEDDSIFVPDDYVISKTDEKKLLNAWHGAGIDSSIPESRKEALNLLLTRAQSLQNKISDIQDGLKVTAEKVENDFQIKKTNFMKAAGLHAIKLKSGAGKAGEKLDDAVDGAENLLTALEPLIKSNK